VSERLGFGHVTIYTGTTAEQNAHFYRELDLDWKYGPLRSEVDQQSDRAEQYRLVSREHARCLEVWECAAALVRDKLASPTFLHHLYPGVKVCRSCFARASITCCTKRGLKTLAIRTIADEMGMETHDVRRCFRGGRFASDGKSGFRVVEGEFDECRSVEWIGKAAAR
jgi:hypothetical protein